MEKVPTPITMKRQAWLWSAAGLLAAIGTAFVTGHVSHGAASFLGPILLLPWLVAVVAILVAAIWLSTRALQHWRVLPKSEKLLLGAIWLAIGLTIAMFAQ